MIPVPSPLSLNGEDDAWWTLQGGDLVALVVVVVVGTTGPS